MADLTAEADAWKDVWRDEAPHVLAALLRRHRDLADCEDAVQLALLAAAEQWPRDGLPTTPRAWLHRVASRRLVDIIRADASRRDREARAARLEVRDLGDQNLPEDDSGNRDDGDDGDDTLTLMTLCAHPALTAPSQVALTLRAVAGLTTAEIATCFFVPEPTMAQRISRAKATLRAHGAIFSPPTPAELPCRLHAVRHTVAAIYTQDHSLAERVRGADPLLGESAVRLAREVHRARPSEPESAGLLALLLLTHARSPARLDAAGEIVPLPEQDRLLWDQDLIAEGIALLVPTLSSGYVGAFQLQAAIAAVHAEAPSFAATDWPQILELYRMLERVDPTPSVALGLAVATAEVAGPQAGLDLLARSPEQSHRHQAVTGHLLARLGREAEAREAFLRAAEGTHSLPEQRYLLRLAGHGRMTS
ncbi:MAG: RNA polymerase sigma factor [Brachybacterium tyrofermentans]